MPSIAQRFRNHLRVTTAVALAAICAAGAERAHAEYPERQITIYACFAAGGGTDIATRLIATPLSEALGKPVVVENRAGAGGNIGIAAVARAAPDGYTLLACSSAFDVNPSLYAQVFYDPFNDFSPIMVLGAAPNVFVAPAASNLKTLADFIAKAKASPGKLNWTSPGAGTTPYLAGELLKIRTGIDVVHIPFPGAGPAIQAALGGQIDMMTANYGSIGPQIEAGLFRALAVTAKERWPDIKDVPTLDELGIKDAESDTFQAIFAPAGTPRPIVDRLAKEIGEILKRPDIRERFDKAGLPVLAEPPEVFRARIAQEIPKYREIVEKAGLKVK